MYESDLNSLENRVHELEKENRYLKSLLDKAGIEPNHASGVILFNDIIKQVTEKYRYR